ncbi:MAG: hypothetical protein GY795_02630 [Desulfobacterales bacterium]|nr:hypothetical protein [Desulfobacterales bacterium]
MSKTDNLIRQAEDSMLYFENKGDWQEFSRLRAELEEIPDTYVLVMTGPDVNKSNIKDLEVDFRSVKGVEFKHIYDYLGTRFGKILKNREICAAACLLENIHQHVKKGIGFCVIRVVHGKYKRITVSDNGTGFYNYTKHKRLPVTDAIKSGKSYGSRYKSEGQALALSFGLWADFATVETPNDTVIIVPEPMLGKIMKSMGKIFFSLVIAFAAGIGSVIIREDISAADILIILAVFVVAMQWSRISQFFSKKKAEKKYFPEIRFMIKNKQKFGSVINVYFCDSRDMKQWRSQVIDGLKEFFTERAKSFRRQI